MFYDELKKYSWDATTEDIAAKTPADVERALTKEYLDIQDFMALISPAASTYLEPMAQLAHKYTLERFGRTISLYIPMYVSNACTNHCVYCGFNHHNPLTRVTLTLDQVKAECEAIRKLGPFENLL
ncbi:MAG: 2-iminoacetate synthase ThiH, partial [Paramuribaculum sp.]|nr:2-iminoacetate synthase ThiH [Paramuribaculum sp.]